MIAEINSLPISFKATDSEKRLTTEDAALAVFGQPERDRVEPSVVLMSDYCKCTGSFYALAVPRVKKWSRFPTFQHPSPVMYDDVFVSAT